MCKPAHLASSPTSIPAAGARLRHLCLATSSLPIAAAAPAVLAPASSASSLPQAPLLPPGTWHGSLIPSPARPASPPPARPAAAAPPHLLYSTWGRCQNPLPKALSLPPRAGSMSQLYRQACHRAGSRSQTLLRTNGLGRQQKLIPAAKKLIKKVGWLCGANTKTCWAVFVHAPA